uniref:dermatan-sulfate epimerase-like protein n=1 Tax=Styela clava TaxID=7725 RepID=UPI00193A0C82|nr:dermatan-sulfate epimerase-like protein [Styela clava]
MGISIMVGLVLIAGSYALFGYGRRIDFSDGFHPMLYFSSSQIHEISGRATTTHEKIARDIREAGIAFTTKPDRYLPPKNHSVFASRWNEVYGNNLCGFAMYVFLYPTDKAAFRYITTYMDRMASYPDWYVAESYLMDQVPVGHSLIGFSTAFDLLYNRFDLAKRQLYYKKINSTSHHLYEMTLKSKFGWTKQYTHNHAASNIVALLIGSLLVSVHEPDVAEPWIAESKKHLDAAMLMLSHVTDGSLDEGVSYGSYTSRGLTQYVYLAKKHLKTDHTSNPWLKQHFWFYYKTILPGFQRSVGIADANHNWFFGPGSQLTFLDNYVMKNGYGNWLAAKIRRARPKNKPLAPSNAQIWSMMHTEYIFYNASVRPRQPAECNVKNIHFYSDWGVVTYGGGEDMKKGNTFLSFKSGVPNGESAVDIMFNNRYPDQINAARWKNFNPGHEHPDQNSFVFAPNGRYFITESLYGPKYSYLDNVVVFSPSNTSQCNQPWEGQIGECNKWLKYQILEEGMRGDILTAVTSNGIVFIAGEAANIYSKSLQLSSVYRGILLLNPEVLIVVDSIKLDPGSGTKRASSLFHNMLHKFKEYHHLGYEGAQVHYPEGSYSMFSVKMNDRNINTTLHSGVRPIGLREGPTNFINVTYSLSEGTTNVVHIFTGPNYNIKSASILPKSGPLGVMLSVSINNIEHVINISTAVKPKTKKASPIKDRKSITGFGGYAFVKIGSNEQHLGLDSRMIHDNSEAENDIQPLHHYVTSQMTTSQLPDVSKFTLSTSKTCSSFPKSANSKSINSLHYWPLFSVEAKTIVLPLTAALFVLFVLFLAYKKNLIRRSVRKTSRQSKFGVFSLVLLTIINLLCIDKNGTNTCFDRWQARNLKRESVNSTAGEMRIPSSPFVFVTALPGSGSELMEYLFEDENEFLFINSPDNITIPVKVHDTSKINLCLWNSLQNQFNLITMGWFTSLITKPLLHFNQNLESKYILEIRRKLRQNFNPTVVLNDNSGFWITKLPWIRQVVGKGNFQPILVVRDPRSWVRIILYDRNTNRRRRLLNSFAKSYRSIGKSCDVDGLDYPEFYWHFKQFEALRKTELSTVEQLAVIWTISIANALTNEVSEGQWPLHIVRFEDVVSNTERTATNIFEKLGLPLKLRFLNKLTRVARSQYFTVPFDGIIKPSTTHIWKMGLSESNIRKIVEICCPLMTILKYEC